MDCFDALLEHYRERGQRVVELEQLCRDLFHCAKEPECCKCVHYNGLDEFYGCGSNIYDRMKSFGLLEEEND